MNIAIIGSRDISLEAMKQIKDYIRQLPSDTTIVTGAWYQCGMGGANATYGADRCALEGAIDAGLRILMTVANGIVYKDKAGLIRNHDTVKYADKVVAFWNGKSTGTMHTVNLAKKAGKIVEVIRVDPTTDEERKSAAERMQKYVK